MLTLSVWQPHCCPLRSFMFCSSLSYGSATYSFFFFFNDTATTEIYTLSLHDALPICDAPLVEAGAGRIVHGSGGVEPNPHPILMGQLSDRHREDAFERPAVVVLLSRQIGRAHV